MLARLGMLIEFFAMGVGLLIFLGHIAYVVWDVTRQGVDSVHRWWRARR